MEPKGHYHIHNNLSLVPTLSLINPVHMLSFHSFEANFNIILPPMSTSTRQSCSFKFSNKSLVSILLLVLCAQHVVPIPSHLPHYLVRSTNHSLPHYAFFSDLLLCLPSHTQIYPKTSYSWTPSVYVLLLMWDQVSSSPALKKGGRQNCSSEYKLFNPSYHTTDKLTNDSTMFQMMH